MRARRHTNRSRHHGQGLTADHCSRERAQRCGPGATLTGHAITPELGLDDRPSAAGSSDATTMRARRHTKRVTHSPPSRDLHGRSAAAGSERSDADPAPHRPVTFTSGQGLHG